MRLCLCPSMTTEIPSLTIHFHLRPSYFHLTDYGCFSRKKLFPVVIGIVTVLVAALLLTDPVKIIQFVEKRLVFS